MEIFKISTFEGSVLSVWTLVESVLTNDGQKKGQHAKMQVSWTIIDLVIRKITLLQTETQRL